MNIPLSCLNYMNVIAYVANVAVTYGIGVLGIAGTPTNAELSEKYQTLVTPTGFSFAIWGPIFIAQLIFTIVQLLPTYRGSPLVASAVGYDYVGVCVSQIAWTLSFTFEIIWLSVASMFSILYFLLKIVNDQYKETSVNPSSTPIREYWLLKFPFSIHCGWIIAASSVNLSVLLVDRGISSDIQFYIAVGTLAALVVISAFSVAFPVRPEFVIPFVLAWASFGIFTELGNPNELILSNFTADRITLVRNGALVSMSLILVVVVLKFILNCRKKPEAASADESASYTRIEDGVATRGGRSRASTRAAESQSVVSGMSGNS